MDGEADHPLANWLDGQDFIHQMDGALGHAPPAAARAKSAFFATKRDQVFVAARLALSPQESMGQDAALEILPELLFHEVRERAAALLVDQP